MSSVLQKALFGLRTFIYASVSRSESWTSIYGNYKSDSRTARCHSSRAESRNFSLCCLEVRQSDFCLPKLQVRN